MRTIYKYSVTPIGTQTITIHENYEIVHFEIQDGVFCFWAMVNTENPLVKKDFIIIGTGQEVPKRGWYVKTCSQFVTPTINDYNSHNIYTDTSLKPSKLMWHLFEIL